MLKLPVAGMLITTLVELTTTLLVPDDMVLVVTVPMVVPSAFVAPFNCAACTVPVRLDALMEPVKPSIET